MFDIGWTELLLIGIVSLIVIGPKDLPGMFRTLGRFTAKIRAMGREFQRAMEAAADESGVKDVASDLRKATNPGQMGLDALKDAARSLDPRTPDVRSATRSASGAAKAAAPGTPPGPAATTATAASATADTAPGVSATGAAAAGAAVAAASTASAAEATEAPKPDPLAFPPSPEDDRT